MIVMRLAAKAFFLALRSDSRKEKSRMKVRKQHSSNNKNWRIGRRNFSIH